MKYGFVYILASKPNGTLYIGVSSQLKKRVYQHQADLVDGFSKKHAVHRLVYFEGPLEIEAAITREKKLKRWRREWKLYLIEEKNPNWDDLYSRI